MKNIILSVQLSEEDTRRFIQLKRDYEDLHATQISNAELVRIFIGIVEAALREVNEMKFND